MQLEPPTFARSRGQEIHQAPFHQFAQRVFCCIVFHSPDCCCSCQIKVCRKHGENRPQPSHLLSEKLVAQREGRLHQLQALSGVSQPFDITGHAHVPPLLQGIGSISESQGQAGAQLRQFSGMLADALADQQEEILGVLLGQDIQVQLFQSRQSKLIS